MTNEYTAIMHRRDQHTGECYNEQGPTVIASSISEAREMLNEKCGFESYSITRSDDRGAL